MKGGYFSTGEKNEKNSFFSQEFFRSSVIQWSAIGSLFLNAVSWGVMLFFIRPVDFPIVLHYNVFFGVDMIGFWWQAYFLPLLGIIILLINGILGFLFYQQKERVVAHLLLLAAFIVQLSLIVAVISIILINY
jgi:hypothetical protein